MKNKCLLFKKLMNIFLLIACCFVFVGCEGENSVEEVSITISPSATTISTGESIKFEVLVSGSANQSFTWNISHPELLAIDINYNAVLKTEVEADTAITVTVTSDADKSKSDSTVILAKANNDKPTVPTPPVADLVVGIEGTSEIKSGKSINLTAVVSGTDNQEVTWSIVDGSEYVSIDEKGVLTAINVDSDHNIKVKATSVANPDFSATKTITLVGKPELTQEMLDQISTDKLSFDGYIQINLYTTGIFEKLYQTYNTPIKTAMDGTNWYAEYLNGETGTAMQMYFKNHESVACQIGVSFMNDEEYFPMLDDFGNEVSWNEAGLYNSFPNLKVSDFKFNEEIWRYEYVGVDKTIINKIISSANPYDFDATNLSLIIDEGEILGIHSKAKADYTIVAGYKAMQELFVTMNYGDFLIKNQRLFCIIDANPNLVRFLSTGSIFLKVNGEDEKKSAKVFSNNRHTVVFSHPDPNIVAKNSNISLATMIGKLKYRCEGDIDGHHEMNTVDNRIGSVQILPEEAHNKVHAITGRNSHRLDAEIKTLKALKQYIKFMESGEYRALFAAEL